MPLVSLAKSPLVPGVTPVELHYGDDGAGAPLVLLHGGWGNTIYSFDRQVTALSKDFRVICPDRSGYGRSNHLLNSFTRDFHYPAAAETVALLDLLGISEAIFWGHSDGAVIAAIIGFTAPRRARALILEAFHFWRLKPASRAFFEDLVREPENLPRELREKFALEFGRERWRATIVSHAQAWIEIARDQSSSPDLYDGRLEDVVAPTLFIHGQLDPRTEPGELEAAQSALPHAEMQVIAGAGHSPHSESGSAELVTEIAREFMKRLPNSDCPFPIR